MLRVIIWSVLALVSFIGVVAFSSSARFQRRVAPERAMPRSRFATGAIALELLLGIGAVGGGIALMSGPSGEILPLPVSALAGSPFANYFAPGAILFAVLGLGPLVAAVITWRQHPVAPFLALVVGGALLIWLIVEILIVGYSSHPPLQAAYLGLGVVITLLGAGWLGQMATRRRAR